LRARLIIPALKQELSLSRHDPRLATSDENDGYDLGQPIAAADPFKCLGRGDEKTNNSPFQMAETIVGEAITAFFRSRTIFRGAAAARE
jgi:hypothetical protein